MKAIINAKKYDTSTARLIGTFDNGLGVYDFRNVEEELYLKKTGEFFLFGKGGALTRYSASCGGTSRCAGSKIIPLTKEEALHWCEDVLDSESIEEIFGEIPE